MAILQIGPIVSPSLPNATTDYNQQYQDQILNVLRLYFNQIDNFTKASLIPASGSTADRPTNRFLTSRLTAHNVRSIG